MGVRANRIAQSSPGPQSGTEAAAISSFLGWTTEGAKKKEARRRKLLDEEFFFLGGSFHPRLVAVTQKVERRADAGQDRGDFPYRRQYVALDRLRGLFHAGHGVAQQLVHPDHLQAEPV